MLPPPLLHSPASSAPVPSAAAPSPASTPPPSLQDGKRAELLAALEAHGFDAAATAKALGMPRSSIYPARKRYGIKSR